MYSKQFMDSVYSFGNVMIQTQSFLASAERVFELIDMDIEDTGENSRLVKQGDGILNLPAVEQTHSGSTDVWAGTLNFDGAMAEPHVWVDGQDMGFWAYGYNTFRIGLGRAMKAGRHTLAVHLNNVEESSRWYPGAGIYRPVRLIEHPTNYLDTWDTFARTTRLSGISADGTSATEATLYVTTQAIIDASKSRLRPVTLASLTTVLGMVPLLFDDMFSAMAATIMGGLMAGTVIVLVFIPVLYSLFFFHADGRSRG